MLLYSQWNKETLVGLCENIHGSHWNISMTLLSSAGAGLPAVAPTTQRSVCVTERERGNFVREWLNTLFKQLSAMNKSLSVLIATDELIRRVLINIGWDKFWSPSGKGNLQHQTQSKPFSDSIVLYESLSLIWNFHFFVI